MDFDVNQVAKIGGSGGSLALMLGWLFKTFRGDIRRVEVAQSRVNDKLWGRMDEHEEIMNAHKLEDARTLVTRDEFSAFRTHMDDQFEKTRTMLFNAFNGQNK